MAIRIGTSGDDPPPLLFCEAGTEFAWSLGCGGAFMLPFLPPPGLPCRLAWPVGDSAPPVDDEPLPPDPSSDAFGLLAPRCAEPPPGTELFPAGAGF
jgi:hypothetical protein